MVIDNVSIGETFKIFLDKSVWISGVTGFKGSWLAEWLLMLGARVHGFSLEPNTSPSLFEQLGLHARIVNEIGDVRDFEQVRRSITAANPDFVFHLAAQPLVRLSYSVPVETYSTNVMGSIHVMEVLRRLGKPCIAVMITTDKCYENQEWLHSYREGDPMGGFDPYSSSKGMAELAINAYRRSYFCSTESPVKLASARAGNVIGGGDWALDRIVPDCIRSLKKGQPIPVRNKVATRPWQHVLEPLSGYLLLAALLAGKQAKRTSTIRAIPTSYNFGPDLTSNRTVRDLVIEILKWWPGRWEDRTDPEAHHEASLLNLATDRAFHLLGWCPRWRFETTIKKTVEWYIKALHDPTQAQSLVIHQIREYMETS